MMKNSIVDFDQDTLIEGASQNPPAPTQPAQNPPAPTQPDFQGVSVGVSPSVEEKPPEVSMKCVDSCLSNTFYDLSAGKGSQTPDRVYRCVLCNRVKVINVGGPVFL